MNERDSEIIEQLLATTGYLLVNEPESADLILINTCSIRDKAEQKVYSLLGQLAPLKKKNDQLVIGVIGCVAQQESEKICKRAPYVDMVVGTQQIYRIPEMLNRLTSGQTTREIATDLTGSFVIPSFQKLLKKQPPSPASEFRKFVTIMQGCNNYCSYCVVPSTRGREISRPVADIVEEVQILIGQGVKEITLLGQNVNSYGQTNQVAEKTTTFADLLYRVSEVPGLSRLRFTTSNPKDLSMELIRCFSEIDILCPHFHLPVQSGSNHILKQMNRKYTREVYLERVDALRQVRPDIALATDIIVGFPGESDEDFALTMDLLETVHFHGSFSFKYSDRPNTRSANFKDKVPENIKKERLRQFQSRQDQISLEQNKKYVDTLQKVMVEAGGGDKLKGRTVTNHIVHFPCRDALPPGEIIDVQITRAGMHSLQGEIAA
jgi:tRNA-2-methylthio-N6-dimethylallyladenosine synthase